MSKTETVVFEELKRIEIFRAGTHRKKTYTEDDLQEIADNTNKLLEEDLHRPPAKLGHDDNQTYAAENGLPAVGWVKKVYAEGKRLFADFRDVPAVIAKAVKAKLYDAVSAEIYLEPIVEREFKLKGKVLRAVAFLGADVPQVKGMTPLSALLSETKEDYMAVKLTEDNDADDKGGDKDPKLMVPANRHHYGALVAHNAEPGKKYIVHNQHPDGSYDIHEMGGSLSKQQVPHDELSLMSEDDTKKIYAEYGERLKLQAPGKTNEETDPKGGNVTDEEKKALESKTADALKLAEKEKAERVRLENKVRDEKIQRFCDENKETLIPAIVPQFKAIAVEMSGVTKFDDKEVDRLDNFLGFAKELMKAKTVKFGELAGDDKKAAEQLDKGAETAITKLSEDLGDTLGRASLSYENADITVLADKYMEEHKGVSFRDALLAVKKITNKEAK